MHNKFGYTPLQPIMLWEFTHAFSKRFLRSVSCLEIIGCIATKLYVKEISGSYELYKRWHIVRCYLGTNFIEI